MANNMQRSFMVSLLLMLSLIPESEKNLGQLLSVIGGAQNAVQSLRNGWEGFYVTLRDAFKTIEPETTDVDNKDIKESIHIES